MRRLLHTIDRISDWSGKLVSYLLFVTMVVIGFELFMRIFERPQIWVFDISLFTAGTVYVVGGAYALLEDRHVKMDILYVRLSARTRALLDLVTLPCFVLFCGVILWMGAVRGWESFLLNERLWTAFHPIVWPFRLMIPLGALLLLLQGLSKAVRDFHVVVTGETLR